MRQRLFTLVIFSLSISIAALVIYFVMTTWPRQFTYGDSIAQFMPVTVEGWRTLKTGELPLFNFWQIGGMPILNFGYFPVMYPGMWIAAFFSEAIFRDIQQLWNVMYALQILLTTAIGFLYLRNVWRLNPWLCSVGGLGLSLGGYGISNQWFYVIAAPFFITALAWCWSSFLQRPNYLNAGLTLLTTFSGISATNVNILFYGYHVSLALVTLEWLMFPERFPKRRAIIIKRMGAYVGLTIAGLTPLFLPIIDHMRHSIRGTGSVSMEKFFWTTAELKPLFLGSLVTRFHPEELPSLFLEQNTYHFGFASAVAISIFFAGRLLSLFSPKFHVFKNRAMTVGLILFLVFVLFSLGKIGGLGFILFNLPFYSWFRHSSKWIFCYQAFGSLFGVILIGHFFFTVNILKHTRRWMVHVVSAVVVGLSYVFFLGLIFGFTDTEPFTPIKLPIPQSPFSSNIEHRHVGVFLTPNIDDVYSSQKPKHVLGHNYGSLIRVPNMLAYEPLIDRQQSQITNGFWFPGLIINSKDFLDLSPSMERWFVRYIWALPEQVEDVLKIVKENFPKEQISVLPISHSHKTAFIVREDTPKLVNGTNALITHLRWERGNTLSFNAHITAPTALTLAFSFYRHFTLMMRPINAEDSKMSQVSIHEDEFGRIESAAIEPGHYYLELEYNPVVTKVMIYGLFAMVAICFVVAIASGLAARISLRTKTMPH